MPVRYLPLKSILINYMWFFIVKLKFIRSFTATAIEINRYEILISTSYQEMVWKVIGDMSS